MVNKTISLSPEMFETLKGEENASALIERLLKNYYSVGSVEKETKKDDNTEKYILWGNEFIERLRGLGRTDEQIEEYVRGGSSELKFKWERYKECLS